MGFLHPVIANQEWVMNKVFKLVVWFSLLLLGTAATTAAPMPGRATRLSNSGSSGGTSSPAPTSQSTLSPLVITTTSMPDGNVGTQYNNFITSSGGRGTPHKWSLIAGQLRDGLSTANFYGVQSTVVSGTPRQVQTTTFTVKV